MSHVAIAIIFGGCGGLFGSWFVARLRRRAAEQRLPAEGQTRTVAGNPPVTTGNATRCEVELPKWKWTCGKCGESYESPAKVDFTSGPGMGEHDFKRWIGEHKADHEERGPE